MTPASFGLLVLLAALWGASFMFLRLGVPAFGAGWIIELRVGIAFLFLLGVGRWLGRRIDWRAHWRHYATIGLFNSALPFLLFAYAAGTLPASVLSVFNSTAPIWGALLGLVFLRQPVTATAGLGLALGVSGVALMTLGEGAHLPVGSSLPILAAVLAPLCYAIASGLAQRAPQAGGAFENAAGSMGASSLMVLPFCLAPFPGQPEAMAWGSALALGILCTGAAYLMYFRLITDVGPVRALSVTFLIPLFGTFWGVVFLNESLTPRFITGGLLIVVGTILTTGIWRVSLRTDH
jgi:drug/metabolite transporter (DMT)-like permease